MDSVSPRITCPTEFFFQIESKTYCPLEFLVQAKVSPNFLLPGIKCPLDSISQDNFP